MSKDLIQLTPGSVKKATVGVSSGDLWKMPRDRIRVIPGFNVREKDADYKANVRRYADSMKANGYDETKPMAGFVFEENGEHFIGLTDGHTRLDAVDLAIKEGCEIVTIPVVTKARGTSMEDITIGLVTSNSGAALKPLEVAKVCKRLVGYGMEVKEIANRLTLTPAYVNQLLDLLAAPKPVRDLVANGTIAATLAMETIKKHGKDAAKMLTAGVKQAKGTGKTRVTAKHVKAATAPKESPAKGKKVAAAKNGDVSLLENQLLGLMDGIGASEDHEDVRNVFRTAGISEATIDKMFERVISTSDFNQAKASPTKGKKVAAPVQQELPLAPAESFVAAWAQMQARGYNYGEDALQHVRLGWKLANESAMRPSDKDGLLELGRVWIDDHFAGGDTYPLKAMLAFLAGVPLEQVQALFPEATPAAEAEEL